MATCIELKKIVKARLRSAEILIGAKDWDGAAYMLGYVLECALKAGVCKSLRLKQYPENRKTDGHFMTHNFDQLLVLSGMSDIFSLNSSAMVFKNWSDFTKEFPGDWPTMRYNRAQQISFDESKVRGLYANLNGGVESVINVMTTKRRW